jgi:hypothetical protein
VTGGLSIGTPPDEISETVDATRSRLVMVHEYDATPEDIPAGLGVAMATQLHPAFFTYYQGGMPWELLFLDLGGGAQLMAAVLAFHDTPDGTAAPLVGAGQSTYRVLATLRLRGGRSVPLDDELRVEHLSYRTLIGRVPTLFVSTTGVWVQAWDYRLSHPGGTYRAPNGDVVTVPPFDLGVVPQLDKHEPPPDARGNRLTQRIPYTARGSYDGCAVDGFGWSEIIVNWYRREDRDPWFTGGTLPEVPDETCGAPVPPSGPPGALDPPAMAEPPTLVAEGCQAYSPGPTPRCAYDATSPGGLVGGGAPGGWRVTVRRGSQTLVFVGLGGTETYACGAIQPGDHVEAEATAGGVTVGTPGFC